MHCQLLHPIETKAVLNLDMNRHSPEEGSTRPQRRCAHLSAKSCSPVSPLGHSRASQQAPCRAPSDVRLC